MLFCWRTVQPVAASELRADWVCRGVGTSKLDWCWGVHERRVVTLGPPIKLLAFNPNKGLRVSPEMVVERERAGDGRAAFIRRFELGLVLVLV